MENVLEITETCPVCGQPMNDGEFVQTNWAGDAIAHVNCPNEENGQ